MWSAVTSVIDSNMICTVPIGFLCTHLALCSYHWCTLHPSIGLQHYVPKFPICAVFPRSVIWVCSSGMQAVLPRSNTSSLKIILLTMLTLLVPYSTYMYSGVFMASTKWVNFLQDLLLSLLVVLLTLQSYEQKPNSVYTRSNMYNDAAKKLLLYEQGALRIKTGLPFVHIEARARGSKSYVVVCAIHLKFSVPYICHREPNTLGSKSLGSWMYVHPLNPCADSLRVWRVWVFGPILYIFLELIICQECLIQLFTDLFLWAPDRRQKEWSNRYQV